LSLIARALQQYRVVLCITSLLGGHNPELSELLLLLLMNLRLRSSHAVHTPTGFESLTIPQLRLKVEELMLTLSISNLFVQSLMH